LNPEETAVEEEDSGNTHSCRRLEDQVRIRKEEESRRARE
jgi:hypothetical protein